MQKSPDQGPGLRAAAHRRLHRPRSCTYGPCPSCDGARLNEAARSRSTGSTSPTPAPCRSADLAEFVRRLTATGGRAAGRHAAGRPWTRWSRSASATSASSADRAPCPGRGPAGQDGPPPRFTLSDVTYIFDEPTVGLHPRDVARMNNLLVRLRDKGNTVLVVEHDRDVIGGRPRGRSRARRRHRRRRDRAVRGHRGRPAQQRHPHRPASRRPGPVEGQVRTATGALPIRTRATHNLRDGRRRHADRGDDRGHRGGGLGQELADPRGRCRGTPAW